MTPNLMGAPWTAAETATLRERYATDGPRALAALLGRSMKSVASRARKIGAVTPRPKWSDLEDRRLRNALYEVSMGWAARRVGRTPRAAYDRAVELGLPVGQPAGYESLSASSNRTGFHITALRQIFAWAGVRTRLIIAQPNPSRSTVAGRNRMVEIADADDAIERWMKAETPTEAAARFGVVAPTIRRAVVASGLTVPPRRGRHRHWLIPSDVIDRAMAARAERAA